MSEIKKVEEKKEEKEENIKAIFHYHTECPWFFNQYKPAERKKIFDIIYSNLYDQEIPTEDEESQFSHTDSGKYIETEDNNYIKKTTKEIFQNYYKKKEMINKSLQQYNIQLVDEQNSRLFLKDLKEEYLLEIDHLRKIKFGKENEYNIEWICNPYYLLYYQYFILKYKKPSRVIHINEKEEQVQTIDSVDKAYYLLENNCFIWIKDSEIHNIDFNKLFEDGHSKTFFNIKNKSNIFKYLDYSKSDPKQLPGTIIVNNLNYFHIFRFCEEPKFESFIYSFNNGYYFFEYLLIEELRTQFFGFKYPYLYLNFNKIKKIQGNKYIFKEYLGFWITKLFPQKETEQNKPGDYKQDYIELATSLIKLLFNNKKKYIENLLNILNDYFKIRKEIALVILNNIDTNQFNEIQNLNGFSNLNILIIFNIQNNFGIFKNIYYEDKKLKKFFLENNDEISYENSYNKDENKYFYSIYSSKTKYENSKKEMINEIFKKFNNKDRLLNIAMLLNIKEFLNIKEKKENSIMALKANLDTKIKLDFLSPFLSLINLKVLVDENSTNFEIDDIKFKEIYIYNYLKELYASEMVNFLNKKSKDFLLDDIKGPLLEKDIILNLLTGQIKINNNNYDKMHFKEVKVQSIYCLNYKNDANYIDNSKNNVMITQESKTGEYYDFSIKIYKNGKNHMKGVQVTTYKSSLDFEKINEVSISLDIINFDLNYDELKIGKIGTYSFAIITSINVYYNYKNCKEKDKKESAFFLMKEHCFKNNFEFYIYDYFKREIYIYNSDKDEIELSNSFFDNTTNINLYRSNKALNEFIKSGKKISLKGTKNDLLYPIENYYQADNNKKIHLINLAKYEFNINMLKMTSGIKNIGLAFWNNYGRQFDNLLIKMNGKSKYFKRNKIIEKPLDIFRKPTNSGMHSLLFLYDTLEVNVEKSVKKFLMQKRKRNELYFGKFNEIKKFKRPKKEKKEKKYRKLKKEKKEIEETKKKKK